MKIEYALDCAIRAAIEAGHVIMDIRNSGFGIRSKSDGSPVTAADIAADRKIASILAECFPEIPRLTEETADRADERLKSEYCFIIDPLDGTKEFVRGSEEFTVNIALSRGDTPVIGVIYIPCTDTLYYASKDHGAYRLESTSIRELSEAVPIRVSDQRNDLTLVTGHTKVAQIIDRVGGIVTVRPLGSSLKGCLVADGSVDICVCPHPTHEWDTAAMQCICTEAGGVMRLLCGDELRCNQVDTVNHDGFYILNHAENSFVLDKLLGK